MRTVRWLAPRWRSAEFPGLGPWDTSGQSYRSRPDPGLNLVGLATGCDRLRLAHWLTDQCSAGGCMIRSAMAMASAENRKAMWMMVCHINTLSL